MHDGKRVVECLKKALKTSGQCLERSVQVQLYVEILNTYIWSYEVNNEQVSLSTSVCVYVCLTDCRIS